MSSGCGNCDCADKTNCTKKRGFQLEAVVEISCNTSFSNDPFEAVALENDCKCGPSCQCVNCTCH
eukprot:Gb_30908 [translate_table: standard]